VGVAGLARQGLWLRAPQSCHAGWRHGRPREGHGLGPLVFTGNQPTLEINQHYGLAVIIIHMARETDIVSITWWTWENVLEQALFIGPPGEPARLKDVTGQGLLACVWELQIHHFESLAWLRTVLSNPQGPDLDAYLSQRFRAVV